MFRFVPLGYSKDGRIALWTVYINVTSETTISIQQSDSDLSRLIDSINYARSLVNPSEVKK
jgi:hypothetical protein